LKQVTTLLNERIKQAAAESQEMTDQLPFWICQVYLRPHNPSGSKKEENKQEDTSAKKRTFDQTIEKFEETPCPLSKNTEYDENEMLSSEKRSKES